MDTYTVVIIAFTVIATVVSVVQITRNAIFLGARKRLKEPTLQEKVEKLTKQLLAATSVISEVETEISKRNELVLSLGNKIETYNQLKTVSDEQLEAIANTLRIPIRKETTKSYWINGAITLVVAFAFFMVGYFIGGR